MSQDGARGVAGQKNKVGQRCDGTKEARSQMQGGPVERGVQCRMCESEMGKRNDKRVQSRRQRSSQVVVYREQRAERRFGEKGSLF